jgi:signal transduction histidine kinase/CheY-like chemotaxis protein
MTNGIALARRFRRASIRSRVILLAAGILVGIVVANYVMLSELRSNAAVAKRQAGLFTAYAGASEAVEAFGDLKYWLTDLAVSQLMLSERNAAAAENRFRAALASLQAIEPETVAAIEVDLAALKQRAGEALLAYEAAAVQPEQRVIGNSMMADARRHISAIDVQLAGLADGLAAQSAEGREAMVASADEALWTLLQLFALLVGASVVGTLGVVHTIVRPLKIMHGAVGKLTAGELDVAIPVDAPAEVAAVGRSLELFRDSVAERNRLAAAEVRQRQILSDAIETIGEGFALFDAEDRLIVSNSQLGDIFPASAPATVDGTSYDALFRSIAVDGGATSDPDRWVAEQSAMRGRAGSQRTFQHGDGQWVRVHERRSAGGETVVVFQDITEQKRREADLAAARDAAEAANVSKSQFIANMSHELRTPLNAIIGYSEMLREETEGLVDAEVHKDLDKIRNAGKHLLALINDVLDLSKIEAGKMTLDTEFVDLADLIDDVQATIRPMCDRNRNTFVLERPAALPLVWADRMRLKQSLLNLLSNACKFTSDGVVTLAARCESGEAGDALVLAVRDTGIGISADKLGGLFQEFMQVDSSATRKYGGTGLGLAISRQFCRLMGGDVTVTSTQGEGSEFVIRLPMLPERGAAGGDTPSLDERAAAGQPGSGIILVIDDSEDDRTLLRRHIEREGFTVVTAASGIEGLALIRAQRPAVVTLDVKMDTLDGWTVLAAIRGDPSLADLPVVMVSVVNDADRGRAMGATGFVDKPVDRDRLIMILEQLTGANAGERRALVVDDDAPSRTVLRRGLEQRGWIVREAANGREALAAVAAERPDLIMLDLMMPDTDGFEVVDQLRRDVTTAGIPVVIVTAKDLTSEDRDRLGGGVVTVLQKGSDNGVDVSRIVRATKLALVETGRIAVQWREPETA